MGFGFSTLTVAARYTNTAGTSITNTGAETTVPFVTKDYDTHDAWDGTNTYTVPIAGKYRISSTIAFANLTWALNNQYYLVVYKNGSAVSYGAIGAAGGAITVSFGTLVIALLDLVAGDTILIKCSNNRTAGASTLNTSAGVNSIDIQRVG